MRTSALLTPLYVVSNLARMLNRSRFADWFVLGAIYGSMLAYGIVFAIHQRHIDAPPPPPLKPVVISSVALPPAPVHKGPVLPRDVNLSVQQGDTLISMLTRKGVDHQEAYNAVESMKKVYDPKRLNVGQSLQMHLDKGDNGKPSISNLSIAVSPIKTITLSRAGSNSDDEFTAREVRAPVYKNIVRGGGVIHSSLYQTGMDSGVPPQLLAEIIAALSYDVDLQRDIHEGDLFTVVYERMETEKGANAGYGKVIYASLTMNNKELDLYRHVSADGIAGYYNAKGESVRKALLKTPINGARITSSFGMRMHPLLGYSRMHKGVDFGAATGTPIYAAGDGVIVEATHKAGYGNYVRVKHSAVYETAYAHASRFARGIRPGVHVKQGQVIAYVGATGMATGPHLHYEILVHGQQVNPSGVKFRTGQVLGGRELAVFRHEVKQVAVTLANVPRSPQVADLSR